MNKNINKHNLSKFLVKFNGLLILSQNKILTEMNIKLLDATQLNFVELNITGDNENYCKMDDESKFIDTIVFNLFTDCFEDSNKLYDYFEPTRYNPRKIVPLLNELKKKLEVFTAISSYTDFKNEILKMFLGSNFLNNLKKETPDLENNWKTYNNQLITVNKELIKLVSYCVEDTQVLWVIGY